VENPDNLYYSPPGTVEDEIVPEFEYGAFPKVCKPGMIHLISRPASRMIANFTVCPINRIVKAQGRLKTVSRDETGGGIHIGVRGRRDTQSISHTLFFLSPR